MLNRFIFIILFISFFAQPSWSDGEHSEAPVAPESNETPDLAYIETLIGILETGNVPEQIQAMHQLEQAGPVALPLLKRLINHSDQDRRYRARMTVGDILDQFYVRDIHVEDVDVFNNSIVAEDLRLQIQFVESHKAMLFDMIRNTTWPESLRLQSLEIIRHLPGDEVLEFLNQLSSGDSLFHDMVNIARGERTRVTRLSDPDLSQKKFLAILREIVRNNRPQSPDFFFAFHRFFISANISRAALLFEEALASDNEFFFDLVMKIGVRGRPEIAQYFFPEGPQDTQHAPQIFERMARMFYVSNRREADYPRLVATWLRSVTLELRSLHDVLLSSEIDAPFKESILEGLKNLLFNQPNPPVRMSDAFNNVLNHLLVSAPTIHIKSLAASLLLLTDNITSELREALPDLLVYDYIPVVWGHYAHRAINEPDRRLLLWRIIAENPYKTARLEAIWNLSIESAKHVHFLLHLVVVETDVQILQAMYSRLSRLRGEYSGLDSQAVAQAFIYGIEHADPTVRQLALDLVRLIEDRDFVVEVLSYIIERDPEPLVGEQAAYLLAVDSRGNDRTLRLAIDLLESSPQAKVREGSARGLGVYNYNLRSDHESFDARIIEALIQAMREDPDETTRHEALNQLSFLVAREGGGDEPSLSYLEAIGSQRLLKAFIERAHADPSLWVRDDAVLAMHIFSCRESLGQATQEMVREHLAQIADLDSEEEIRSLARFFLEQMQDRDSYRNEE